MRVLITPLDWGLGHATRCIPIIRELLGRGCTVFVAGNGDSLLLLKKEFPSLRYFDLPAYDPVYPSGGSMAIKMAFQVPKFLTAIRNEHRTIDSLIQTKKIDLIISDNRYGCWSSRVPSVFITHQLNIQIPRSYEWLSRHVNALHTKLINKFPTCWIPDFPQDHDSLTGELSKPDKSLTSRIVHIGPLSKFDRVTGTTTDYDVVCILSGPEPQRTILEEKVMIQLEGSGLRYLVVRGSYSKEGEALPNTVSFLNSNGLQDVISRSSFVIARSGYSTIMDLVAMRKKAIVIPTPGQTEQEYLAKRWSEKGVLLSMTQDDFNLKKAMDQAAKYSGFENVPQDYTGLLRNELDRALTVPTLPPINLK